MKKELKLEVSEMKVRVDSTDFRNTHGHSPRGYGNWVFYRWLNQRQQTVAALGPMNYKEAKAEAVEFAEIYGHSEIFVGS
jgi:hypothetical protein